MIIYSRDTSKYSYPSNFKKIYLLVNVSKLRSGLGKLDMFDEWVNFIPRVWILHSKQCFGSASLTSYLMDFSSSFSSRRRYRKGPPLALKL
ncbi:hypothetical protein CEXT_574021 [Caerostris extrusa]|uniref:Maturase K n=1 Tax=Caerostris extrusa TaxID=172846 RepID=A0AAV4SER6_CAEEX|nr:hypothetical protein CEXT_574021 [Caerostris extrusa]